jgi:hypothetical protein
MPIWQTPLGVASAATRCDAMTGYAAEFTRRLVLE